MIDRNVHELSESSIRCQVCFAQFSYAWTRDEHMRRVHAEAVGEDGCESRSSPTPSTHPKQLDQLLNDGCKPTDAELYDLPLRDEVVFYSRVGLVWIG